MNKEEAYANKFLRDEAKLCPQYEPNGKSTFPDFCIEDRIAIEVRRLNVNYTIAGNIEGAENTIIPLKVSIQKELAKIPGTKEKGTFGVNIKFSRPLRKIKQLIKKSLERLSEFYTNDSLTDFVEIEINSNLMLECYRMKYNGNAFIYIGLEDEDYDPNLKKTYFENISLQGRVFTFDILQLHFFFSTEEMILLIVL